MRALRVVLRSFNYNYYTRKDVFTQVPYIIMYGGIALNTIVMLMLAIRGNLK